jgi:hypothetical protein
MSELASLQTMGCVYIRNFAQTPGCTAANINEHRLIETVAQTVQGYFWSRTVSPHAIPRGYGDVVAFGSQVGQHFFHSKIPFNAVVLMKYLNL